MALLRKLNFVKGKRGFLLRKTIESLSKTIIPRT